MTDYGSSGRADSSEFDSELENGRANSGRRMKHSFEAPNWRKYWWVIAIIVLASAAIAGGLAEFRQPPTWRVGVDVRVGRPIAFGDTFTDPAYADRVLRTVAVISRSPEVESVSKSEAPDVIYSVEVIRDTELLSMTVIHSDRAIASDAIDPTVEAARSAVERVYGDTVTFMPISGPTTEQLETPRVLFGAAGAFVGLIVGIGVAWLVASRKGR